MSRTSPVLAAYQNLLLPKGQLKPNASQAALIDQLSRLQQELTFGTDRRWWKPNHKYDPARNGIYIYGGVGTGKSRIADLFAATLPPHITRRRAHFFEFMTDIHMRLHYARASPTYTGDPLLLIGREIQQESSVLCLDEFQVSDIADAMMLKRLFGSFWESGGIMVSTSNRHPMDLYKNGLNRPLFIPFIEELQRRCIIFKLQGDHDYRKDGVQQRERSDIFFIDAHEFQDSLSRAANGGRFKPVEISVVMNRKLTVDAAEPKPEPNDTKTSTKQIVSTTFSALCEAFLSAADYHALCNFASTIYLSGLRRFASNEFDVVRRFITLIDVAYESRTRVLCLSTDPILKTFEDIILSGSPGSQTSDDKDSSSKALSKLREVLQDQNLTVKGKGGSSSSMMSTYINNVEWSATGLKEASLATGGAGETDVRFAVGRAISRLTEMGTVGYDVVD